jgi:SAM-dependent methyltransferase
MAFDEAYFERQYAERPWRGRGSKPILDASRLRWLRSFVPRGRVLEIGTGYGALARRASERYSVVGLDLDSRVVASAFEGTPVHGVAGSAGALPLASDAFDLVLCIDVIEHLPEPESCLSEIGRVLRPGGYAYFSTPNPESLGAIRKGRQSFIYRDPTHCSVRPIAEWTDAMTAAGLREVWSGTDTLWDAPYFSWLPERFQWAAFVGLSQLAWVIAPAFRWRWGENFVWLGQRAAA